MGYRPICLCILFSIWALHYFHYLFILVISVKNAGKGSPSVIVMRATNAFSVFAYNFSYLHFCVIAAGPIQMPNGRAEPVFCLCSRIVSTV